MTIPKVIEPTSLLSREQLLTALQSKGIAVSQNMTTEKLRELLANSQAATPKEGN